MPLSIVETLQQLIAIPSVNPMGKECQGPLFGESRLTSHLERWAENLGLDWLRQQVHPDRDNLLVMLRGPNSDSAAAPLLWEVHQDTVAVEGMSIDPFGGKIADNRVYGRGACDVKGGMTAMMIALERLAKERPANCPTIVLAFAINEEFGFSGSKAFSKLWQPECENASNQRKIIGGTVVPEAVFPQPPIASIVAEPTDLNVVVAHKGVLRWRCHAHGRAAHTSDPNRGTNAVYGLAEVTRAIAKYHREVAQVSASHPLCGEATACVTTFHGGVGVNIVPDQATIEIDRRLVPGEDPQLAISDLIDFIQQHADIGECSIEHDPPFITSSGLTDTNNRLLANWIAEAAQKSNQECKFVGARYGTDAAVIAASGVPTVVFGPGSVQQAHTADEWVDIAQLERAADILYELAASGF